MDKEKEYLKLIKRVLNLLLKDRLKNYCIEKGLLDKNTSIMTKQEIINLITDRYYSEPVFLKTLMNDFNSYIGYNSFEVQEILNINKQERLKLSKRGYLKVVGTYEVKVKSYGNKYVDCPVYSPDSVFEIMDNIETLKEQIKPTEAQLKRIEAAQKARVEKSTCKGCGTLKQSSKDLKYGKYCNRCCEHIYDDISYNEAVRARINWLKHKHKYILLDTETTGIESCDEIIEITLMDLDGNIVFESLIYPKGEISEKAYEVHGLTKEQLKNAPTWDMVIKNIYDIIKDRIIIAYNADFDIRLLLQTCRLYGIELGKLQYTCLMENVMYQYSSERWIKLIDAAGAGFQSHRSSDDCRLCLKIINDCELKDLTQYHEFSTEGLYENVRTINI